MSEERRIDLLRRLPRLIKTVLAALLIAGGTVVSYLGIKSILLFLIFLPGHSGGRPRLFSSLIGLVTVFVGLFISVAGSFLVRWRWKTVLGIWLIVVGGACFFVGGRRISQDPFAPSLKEVALGHTFTILRGRESFDVWDGSWGIACGVVLLGVGLGLLITLAIGRKDPSQVQIRSAYPYSFAQSVGVIATILAILVGVVYIYTIAGRPELRLDLLIADTRAEILLHNVGADLARRGPSWGSYVATSCSRG